MEKIWMPVRDYVGLYEVSNYGDVRNARAGRVLKLSKTKDGYYIVDLCKDGKKKIFLVHRLVYETFVGEIPEGMVIDHIDGDKKNNCLENLRVCTQKENINNPVTRPRHIEANRKRCSKSVVQLNKQTGEVIRKWECSADACRVLGVNASGISECCTGKRKSAGNYCWMYFMPPSVIYNQQGLGS